MLRVHYDHTYYPDYPRTWLKTHFRSDYSGISLVAGGMDGMSGSVGEYKSIDLDLCLVCANATRDTWSVQMWMTCVTCGVQMPHVTRDQQLSSVYNHFEPRCLTFFPSLVHAPAYYESHPITVHPIFPNCNGWKNLKSHDCQQAFTSHCGCYLFTITSFWAPQIHFPSFRTVRVARIILLQY